MDDQRKYHLGRESFASACSDFYLATSHGSRPGWRLAPGQQWRPAACLQQPALRPTGDRVHASLCSVGLSAWAKVALRERRTATLAQTQVRRGRTGAARSPHTHAPQRVEEVRLLHAQRRCLHATGSRRLRRAALRLWQGEQVCRTLRPSPGCSPSTRYVSELPKLIPQDSSQLRYVSLRTFLSRSQEKEKPLKMDRRVSSGERNRRITARKISTLKPWMGR